jgi:hypothetical protein|tara:strand:+ start:1282 stop:1506 length:225 start_codon:yes stop_codon:yes gene_type:complete
MTDITPQDVGSYIVRDKRGTYMSGYSQKLGEQKARLWARDCAKRSKGVLYFRQNEGEAEEELESFLAPPFKKRI